MPASLLRAAGHCRCGAAMMARNSRRPLAGFSSMNDTGMVAFVAPFCRAIATCPALNACRKIHRSVWSSASKTSITRSSDPRSGGSKYTQPVAPVEGARVHGLQAHLAGDGQRPVSDPERRRLLGLLGCHRGHDDISRASTDTVGVTE